MAQLVQQTRQVKAKTDCERCRCLLNLRDCTRCIRCMRLLHASDSRKRMNFLVRSHQSNGDLSVAPAGKDWTGDAALAGTVPSPGERLSSAANIGIFDNRDLAEDSFAELNKSYFSLVILDCWQHPHLLNMLRNKSPIRCQVL